MDDAISSYSRGLGAITRFGVSAEMSALFEGLRETPGIHGNKFRPQQIDAVAQSLQCRNYGFLCLELSYLLSAVQLAYADETGAPLLNFFWVDEAITPGRFRRAFATPYAGGDIAIAMGDDYLHSRYGSDTFDMSPTRAGELSAMLEFLVNINPAIIERALVLSDKPAAATIKQFSSELQADIYKYLRDNAKPAQLQRRFHFLWKWMATQAGDDSLPDIDDALILNCWRDNAQMEEDDSLSFKRFRSVAEDFFALHQALTVGDTMWALANHAVIGSDTDFGEISPDMLFQAIEISEEEGESISWLATAPKYLTATQLEPLIPLMNAGSLAKQLPLTLLRSAVFGDWQAVVVQATRNRERKKLTALLNDGPQYDYRQYREGLQALEPKLEQALLSGLMVLLELAEPEALSLIAQQLPEAEAAKLRGALPGIDFDALYDLLDEDDVERAMEVSSRQLQQQFFDQLPQLCLQLPALNQRVQACRKAFKANNREGFKQLPEPGAVGPYVVGYEGLQRVQAQLAQFQAALEQCFTAAEGADEKFSADRSIFMETIQLLYGQLSHGQYLHGEAL